MLNRREFLAAVGSAAGLFILQPYERILLARPRFLANPFTLGVASGDPLPDGVVLWTRLAPDPLNGGGMEPHAVEVRWQIAADEGMKRIVRQGTSQASPELGHSVHVEAEGLKPATTYWYQFESGGVTSPVGRTRTAPALDSHPERLAFAFASCQNWPNGHWAAYRHMSEQDLDLILHLGDYIYEGGINATGGKRNVATLDTVRHEIMTLADYRNRYALYKTDPLLQAAHHRAPFVVTWDDHEVENNYAADKDQNGTDPAEFLKRRAAAYQAYYEHQPLRRAQMAHGADLQLYRRLTYGDLAQFNILDTRQFRSDQANGDKAGPRTAEVMDPSRTMLGDTQETWLKEGLKRSRAEWNVVPQQVFMTQVANHTAKGDTFSSDTWDGYAAERNELMRFLNEARIKNPVVLTGDSHKNLVSDLKADFDDEKSATVGVEFAGTAISSGGIDPKDDPRWQKRISDQEHLKWFEGVKRGYVSCVVDRKTWTSDYWGVEDLQDPQSSVTKSATFVVQNGVPGVQKG